MAKQFKRSIEEFKAELAGGGVRPTMFQVEMRFPAGSTALSQDDVDKLGTYMIKAAQLPSSVVGNIDVPFRGRKLKVSGDRTFEDWNITVTNDVDFSLRKGFEKWSEIIQNMNYALGANQLENYFCDAIVRQLDRKGNQLRAYIFQGIWPTNVAAMQLDMDTTDTVQDFEVTFAVQYWGAAGPDDDPGANSTDPSPKTNKVAINS